MVAKYLLGAAGFVLCVGAMAFGCAKGTVDFGDVGATSAGGAGVTIGSGGTGGNGSGGAGGAGGKMTFPCGVDCTKIKTPACSVASCNEKTSQCVVTPAKSGAPCDDGKFCTIQDTCDEAGICVGGPENSCAMTAPECSKTVCNEETKSCTTEPLDQGTFCTPTDLCQTNGQCSFGQCIGKYNDCLFAPVPDQCHVAKCNPDDGMCVPVPGNDGKGCTDQAELCITGKTCSNGVCIGGKPKDCSQFTKGCFDGKCNANTGQCYADPIPQGQNCAEATDGCNQGKCDAMGKCAANAINEGGACDDGLSCTSGTTCTKGACIGGSSNVTIYFNDEFASNAKGWTLGTEWQIGGAKAAGCPTLGPDPGFDHTVANQNNGVAGVVIGGCENPTIHPYYYLTSPAFDTSSAKALTFSYWRWLNSDYTPFMQNTAEVYDGSKWQIVFQTDSNATNDSAWVQQSFDVLKYKNSQMRVRFGYTIGSGGVYTVSQWNVDDVLVASGPCN